MKIMRWLSVPLILILISFVFSSMNDQGVDSGAKVYTAKLKTLTDQEYPAIIVSDSEALCQASSITRKSHLLKISMETLTSSFILAII